MNDQPGHRVFRATTTDTHPLRLGRGRSQHVLPPGTGATQMTVSQVTIDPFTVPGPLHLHQHANNVYVVLAGEVEVRSGPAIYQLGPGDSIFIPSGEPHSTHNPTNLPVVMMAIYDRPIADDFTIIESTSQHDG